MMAANNVTGQDPNAHLFHKVNWTNWLAERSIPVEDIISIGFTVDAPATKTDESVDGAVATVWVRDVPLNAKIKVVSRITITNHVGDEDIVNDYTFTIIGRQS